METEIKDEVFAYKFSSTATPEKPDILNSETPEGFLKRKYDGRLVFGLDNLHKSGHYRIHGWVFDFTPFMRQYLVKQYDSWQEYYAPNKTLLRKSIFGKIDKIVEIK